MRKLGHIGVFCLLYGREKKPARFGDGELACTSPASSPFDPCGRRHRLSTRDAARDPIDAARARMIDRQDSVVNAKTEGGLL